MAAPFANKGGVDMAFVISLTLLLILLVLLIGRPGIRKLLLAVTAIFSVTFLYFLDKNNKDFESTRIAMLAKENEAATRIKPEDLKMDSVGPVSISFGAYELDGVITNNSKFVLSGISFRISLTDCGELNSCSVVGERDSFISLAVPPGETRRFKGSPIAFTNLPTSVQNRSVSFKLIGTRAEF